MVCSPRPTKIQIVAGLFAVLAAGNAHAIPIGPGGSYDFSWSTTGGGYDLTGTGTIAINSLADDPTAFTQHLVKLQVSLTNTATAGGVFLGNNARLTAWGFGITPNVTGVTLFDGNDGGIVGASLDSIPSLKSIEVCAYGGQNCAGGANGGIPANPITPTDLTGMDVFELDLAGTFPFTPEGNPLSLNIQPFGYKYQTNIGSFEFSCDTPAAGIATTCINSTTPPQPVPEPGSLALLGAALMAGFGVARRRNP